MSLRGIRSGPAFRSDGRGLAFVTGNDRGRVAPAAVGKPDKPTLFDLVRKHFWPSETILWALQSRLQTVPLRINRPCIAKLQRNTLFCRQTKWCISKSLPRPARNSNSDWTALARRSSFPCLSTAARAPSSYA